MDVQCKPGPRQQQSVSTISLIFPPFSSSGMKCQTIPKGLSEHVVLAFVLAIWARQTNEVTRERARQIAQYRLLMRHDR